MTMMVTLLNSQRAGAALLPHTPMSKVKEGLEMGEFSKTKEETMSAVEVINANPTEYWKNIKRRTCIRNANKLVKRELEDMGPPQCSAELMLVKHFILLAADAEGVSQSEEDLHSITADWCARLLEI